MSVVHLRDSKALARVLLKFGPASEKAAIGALRKATRFGHTAIIKTIRQAIPPIRASGTYERSWKVVNTKYGAVLHSTAAHALFVERGRKPGKAPPLAPILEWVYQKRLANRPRPKKKARRKTADPRKQNKQKKKATKKPWKRGKVARAPKVTDAVAFAHAVRWKIAKKGTKGRNIFIKTWPQIEKRAARELHVAFRKLTARPPR